MDIMIEEIGVALPAYQIPDKSIVTKRTETYPYIIKKLKGKGIVILSDINTREVTSFKDDIRLIWVTTENEFYEYLIDKRKEKVL